jgi:hypothetical protein
MNVFDKMILVLEEHGWTKFQLQNDKGEMCILGALTFAKTGTLEGQVDNNNEASLLCELLKEEGYNNEGWPYFPIANYNNAKSTSYEDIVLLLKRASERWEDEMVKGQE